MTKRSVHKPVNTKEDTVSITAVNNLSEIAQLTENVTETYIENNVIQTYSNRFSFKNAAIIVTLFICTVVYIGKNILIVPKRFHFSFLYLTLVHSYLLFISVLWCCR